MEFSISYCQTQVEEAAKFIWENNKSVKKWPSAPKDVFDIYDIIIDYMKRDSRKNFDVILQERKTGENLDDRWTRYSGTGGFFIIYDLIEESDTVIRIDADVLVDPCIGKLDTVVYADEVIDYKSEIV